MYGAELAQTVLPDNVNCHCWCIVFGKLCCSISPRSVPLKQIVCGAVLCSGWGVRRPSGHKTVHVCRCYLCATALYRPCGRLGFSVVTDYLNIIERCGNVLLKYTVNCTESGGRWLYYLSSGRLSFCVNLSKNCYVGK